MNGMAGKFKLTFYHFQCHGFVGEGAKAAICHKANVESRIFNLGWVNDQFVQVDILAHGYILVGIEDPVAIMSYSQSIFSTLFMGL